MLDLKAFHEMFFLTLPQARDINIQ
jgi:hypothetical protein